MSLACVLVVFADDDDRIPKNRVSGDRVPAKVSIGLDRLGDASLLHHPLIAFDDLGSRQRAFELVSVDTSHGSPPQISPAFGNKGQRSTSASTGGTEVEKESDLSLNRLYRVPARAALLHSSNRRSALDSPRHPGAKILAIALRTADSLVLPHPNDLAWLLAHN